MQEPIDLQDLRPAAELPADLVPYVEALRRATADPPTAGLRDRLEGAGFFAAGPRRPRRAARRVPLLRAAGLLAVLGAAIWAAAVLEGGPPMYAEVLEVRGDLLLERGGSRRAVADAFRIRAGDVLEAGGGGCRLLLAGGGSLRLAPNCRVRCVVAGREQKPLLDLSDGGVDLDAGSGSLAFRAAGKTFECVRTGCEVRRCCCWNDPNAVLIAPKGRGLFRRDGRAGPCSATEPILVTTASRDLVPIRGGRRRPR